MTGIFMVDVLIAVVVGMVRWIKLAVDWLLLFLTVISIGILIYAAWLKRKR